MARFTSRTNNNTMPEAAAPYKIILAGMKGVGKTSLFNLLQYNVSEPENEILRTTDSGISSRGRNKITIKTTCFDKPVTVQLWDTGNMEQNGSLGITKSYFRDAQGAICIYEQSGEDSKIELRKWMDMIMNEAPECIMSVWCNNRLAVFGGSSNLTRNIIDDYIDHYKIDRDLIFRYTPENDVDTIHQHFNALVCKVYTLNPYNPRRDSIDLSEEYNQQGNTTKTKCCYKM